MSAGNQRTTSEDGQASSREGFVIISHARNPSIMVGRNTNGGFDFSQLGELLGARQALEEAFVDEEGVAARLQAGRDLTLIYMPGVGEPGTYVLNDFDPRFDTSFGDDDEEVAVASAAEPVVVPTSAVDGSEEELDDEASADDSGEQLGSSDDDEEVAVASAAEPVVVPTSVVDGSEEELDDEASADDSGEQSGSSDEEEEAAPAAEEYYGGDDDSSDGECDGTDGGLCPSIGTVGSYAALIIAMGVVYVASDLDFNF